MEAQADSRLETGRCEVQSTTSARSSAFRERSEPFRVDGRSTATANATVRVTCRPGRCTTSGFLTAATPTRWSPSRSWAGASAWTSRIGRPRRGALFSLSVGGRTGPRVAVNLYREGSSPDRERKFLGPLLPARDARPAGLGAREPGGARVRPAPEGRRPDARPGPHMETEVLIIKELKKIYDPEESR